MKAFKIEDFEAPKTKHANLQFVATKLRFVRHSKLKVSMHRNQSLQISDLRSEIIDFKRFRKFPRVLAIMGSPKKKGNTYKVTRKVEEQMKQLGDVEFEYVFLKDLDLKTCRGCQICFDKGEELCPLKDARAMLEEKMQNADGVIFTSSNYVFNVSGLMKNFMDIFCYVCHRPRFFKNAMALTTSGVGGSRLSLMNLKTAPQIWRFNVVSSLGVVTNGDPKSDLSTPVEKVNKMVKKGKKTAP